MPGCIRVWGWVAAAGLFGIAALAAQGQDRVTGQDQQDTPTFRTDVNYVRVDVFVTRDGEPVTDLRPEDVEVLDQGVRQEISQFEYIQVRGNLPQEIRREPSTVAESLEMLQESRGRVFVLFLDIGHVDADASRTIGRPLVDLLDSVLGADDLIGVMTPGMSALDVTFARKTVALQRVLDREWWGEHNRTVTTEPVESRYEYCYPAPPEAGSARSALASELIERRRETMTLEALEDLVRYLRDAREERKALIAITQGWRLFETDTSLLEPREDTFRIGSPPVGTPGPVTDSDRGQAVSIDQLLAACERDRQTLALTDNAVRFRRLMDLANRANASFYPVDPRGLAVFDAPIGVPDPMLTLQEDNARLRQRQLSLRELAEQTDGLAVVGTNSIREGLRRVVDDLSSYYLLGYFATGVEMDGRFHALTVRVRRPGVTVRARRGYLAPGPNELKAAMAAAAAAPSAAETLRTQRLERALGALGSLSRDLPLRTHVAAGWAPDGASTFQVVGELARTGEWADGADVEVTLTTPGGQTLGTGTATLATGARGFEVALAPDSVLEPGDYVVRVRARSHKAGSPSATDVVTLTMPTAPDGTGALFFRRGPSTGNREVATADRRFRRNERLRLDLPWRPDDSPAARLLDRTGRDLPVPVAAAVRSTGGTSWVSAEIVLAPLAAGDYMVAISSADASGEEREVWTAFRIVP